MCNFKAQLTHIVFLSCLIIFAGDMFGIVGVYKICILCVCLCLVCFADAIIASTCGGQGWLVPESRETTAPVPLRVAKNS